MNHINQAFARIGSPVEAQWLCLAGLTVLAFAIWLLSRRLRLHRAAELHERKMRLELEAYSRLDVSLASHGAGVRLDHLQSASALAARVCRTIAEHSSFTRVLLLLRNAEGDLRGVGSTGVDDLTRAAVGAWGDSVVNRERTDAGLGRSSRMQRHPGAVSFSIPIGEWEKFDKEVGSWAMSGRRERRRWRRAMAVPVRMRYGNAAGEMAGAIVVCADGLSSRRSDAGGSLRVDCAMSALEALAARLGVSLENDALNDRVLRAEKLAGLGQLAGGVAHALNNPLTAVLGFAELISETSLEPRVQEDARTIATEALKMRETVQRLIEFWRPVPGADEPVNLWLIAEEVAAACEPALLLRGVRIEVVTHGEIAVLRGSQRRLRQVVEHLVDNAAQAIAEARPREGSEEHRIKITVTQNDAILHMIVGDTGGGFREPARVFDPFYTTHAPNEGAGLGLSTCYAIVREHGGEIAALNLHPFGAAVVIELPVRTVVVPEVISGDPCTEEKAVRATRTA